MPRIAKAPAAYTQALTQLQARFGEALVATPAGTLFRVDGQLGVDLRRSKDIILVVLAWECRPGVWQHLGDQEDAVRLPALQRMGVGHSLCRNCFGGTDADVLAYVQNVCAATV